MQNLTITLIQQPLHWLDPEANCQQFSRLIAEIEESDLIILPEMFNTGFTNKSELVAETSDGKSMEWLAKTAQEKNCAIVASLCFKEIEREAVQYSNRLIFMRPDGQFDYYDKRHLFRLGREHQHYKSGNRRLVLNFRGWRICPMVCYDLRFPVWARNRNDYDLLLYVANWPAARSDHWRTLLKARAIENISYVAGVNIIGTDGNHISYLGDSVVHDYFGKELLYADDEGGVFSTRLNYQQLIDYRKSFPAHLDADQFEIK
jgi:predicted amidohydrolase